MNLSNFNTKRALKKQIKRLKEDVKYRDKIIDNLETDYAIAKSLIRKHKRENEDLKKMLEDKNVSDKCSVA